MAEPITEADLRERTPAFLADHDLAGLDDGERRAFLRARFDVGLAWVHFPVGLGGARPPGGRRSRSSTTTLAAAGAPDNRPSWIGIGLGMAAPDHPRARHRRATLRRFLRPLCTGEEVWCQLFSEPGAGSDPPGLATRPAATATGGWSTARRCGPRWPTSRAGRSCSPAPTPTCPSTGA